MVDENIFEPIIGQDPVRVFDWEEVKTVRESWFIITDLWYLKDRWDSLSSTKKGELNSFREALRNLPQTYTDATDAADNFPTPEEWF
jgi:hypothetical protein